MHGQYLDTGRVWTAAPATGEPAGLGPTLTLRLRRFARATAQRYASLARQGQLTPRECLEFLLLMLIRAAVDNVSVWRLQLGIAMNDRLRAIRADMWAVATDSRLAQAGQKLRPRNYSRLTCWRSFRPLAQDYDLTVLYGLEVTKAGLLPPDRPYIAFEHATMRTLPFENTLQGRLLALGYRLAEACIITNPDVLGSAKRLGTEALSVYSASCGRDEILPG